MRVLKNAVTLVAIAAAAGGTYQGYKVYNKPVESTLFMQNVEALARGEDGEGAIIICGTREHKGNCWRRGNELKFCGGYSYYECQMTGYQSDNCTEPC